MSWISTICSLKQRIGDGGSPMFKPDRKRTNEISFELVVGGTLASDKALSGHILCQFEWYHGNPVS